MTEVVERVVLAAKRVLHRPIHAVTREWRSKMRAGGMPTRLTRPLSPFTGVQNRAPVVTYAMSATPYASPGGFHIVRYDQADKPDVFNTDSYDEIDLISHPEWPKIQAAARVEDSELDWLVFKYVFLVCPKRRRDHHSPRVPRDISNAKPK